MGVHHNVAAGYLSTSRCESPDVVIHCGLCFRSSDCCAGSSFPKISVGSRIPCNCSTLQSACTHCSFWKRRSLAEWDRSRSVPDGRSRVKSRTCTHCTINNKPFAATRISLSHIGHNQLAVLLRQADFSQGVGRFCHPLFSIHRNKTSGARELGALFKHSQEREK